MPLLSEYSKYFDYFLGWCVQNEVIYFIRGYYFNYFFEGNLKRVHDDRLEKYGWLERLHHLHVYTGVYVNKITCEAEGKGYIDTSKVRRRLYSLDSYLNFLTKLTLMSWERVKPSLIALRVEDLKHSLKCQINVRRDVR